MVQTLAKRNSKEIAGLLEVVLANANLSPERLRRLSDNVGELQENIANIVEELSKIEPVRAWKERNGVISFDLDSEADSVTGPGWVVRLESKNFRVREYAKSVLISPLFKSAKAVPTNKIAVLRGELFSDSERITSKIRAEAKRRGLVTPNAEDACLIREKFSDEILRDMGLWWIAVMHDPIKDYDGVPDILTVNRYGYGRSLGTSYGGHDHDWGHGCGFAFATSATSK